MALAPLFLARAFRLWVVVRLLAAVLFALADASGPAGPLDLAAGNALVVIATTALLGLVDVARRGERALLGNFGVSRAQLGLWLLGPAACGEIALALLLPAVR